MKGIPLLVLVLVAVAGLGPAGAPAARSAASAELGLEHGDLVVGTVVRDNVGTGSGVITRVRGSSTTPFCASPTWTGDPNWWALPRDVIVDSQGRVVFFAGMSRPEGFGLFRCAGQGDAAELLAFLPNTASEDRSRPVPWPDRSFRVIGYYTPPSGLNLTRLRTIVADAHGKPRVVTEDAYSFAVVYRNETTGVVEGKHLRFHATTGRTSDGPDPLALADMAGSDGVDLSTAGKFTYAVQGNVLRRSKETVRIQIADDAHLAFGGYKELRGLLVDDLTFPNTPSGCDPHDDGVSLTEPRIDGILRQIASLDQVVYDRELILTSETIGLAPYLTAVSELLLNDDPEDDRGEYFHFAALGCAHTASLKYRSIMPFWNPRTGAANGVERLAASPFGLVGTQRSGGKVVLVTPGDGVETIVSGLDMPDVSGIAAYPANVPATSGNVVFVEIKSPVNVLLTDASGRRIGVDPATGQAVNDFGEDGYDSGPGEPRLLAIQDPAPGAYSLDFVGTGNGPYAINVNSADLDEPEGSVIRASGTAQPGKSGDYDFTLDADGTVAFETPPPPPPGDTTPPVIGAHDDVTANATSRDGVVVDYPSPTANDNLDGPVAVTCAPPSGILFARGTTKVDCTATDAAGNVGTSSFGVVVRDFRTQLAGWRDQLAGLTLEGQADVRRDSAVEFLDEALAPAGWDAGGSPRTNDAGRAALLQIRQSVQYQRSPNVRLAAASQAIRVGLTDLVGRIAHARHDEVDGAPGASSARLARALESLHHGDARPGSIEALYDYVNAWVVLRNEPPQFG